MSIVGVVKHVLVKQHFDEIKIIILSKIILRNLLNFVVFRNDGLELHLWLLASVEVNIYNWSDNARTKKVFPCLMNFTIPFMIESQTVYMPFKGLPCLFKLSLNRNCNCLIPAKLK